MSARDDYPVLRRVSPWLCDLAHVEVHAAMDEIDRLRAFTAELAAQHIATPGEGNFPTPGTYSIGRARVIPPEAET